MKLWILCGVCVGGFLFMASCASTDESRTGVQDGTLLPCPKAPKCVSTQSEDERHRMEPLSYNGSLGEARDRILDIVQGMEGFRVVTVETNYLYVQFRSKGLGFIDDVDFYFDGKRKIIHFRSSARFGYYDLKVNRNRMEYIADEFTRLTGSGAGG